MLYSDFVAIDRIAEGDQYFVLTMKNIYFPHIWVQLLSLVDE
jgi:hypothetical protein